MATEKNEVEEKSREWNRSVVEAYRNAITPLTRIISSLLGLWALTYILGWKRADSYYSTFGAGWITPELTISNIPSFSYWPVLAFLIGVLVTFTDLAERYLGRGMKGIGIFIVITLILELAAAHWYDWKQDYAQSASAYAALLLSVAMVLGLEFGELALELSGREFQWNSSNVWKVCFLGFWFFASVGSLGSAEGKRDSNPEQTKLEIVESKDGEILRLLLEKDGLIYAAIIREKENPKITILGHDGIRYIYKPATKKRDKENKPNQSSKSFAGDGFAGDGSRKRK